jgi:hypothetical protein
MPRGSEAIVSPEERNRKKKCYRNVEETENE